MWKPWKSTKILRTNNKFSKVGGIQNQHIKINSSSTHLQCAIPKGNRENHFVYINSQKNIIVKHLCPFALILAVLEWVLPLWPERCTEAYFIYYCIRLEISLFFKKPWYLSVGNSLNSDSLFESFADGIICLSPFYFLAHICLLFHFCYWNSL